jgi:dTDP-4-amino-4,6-dideoxygalactose transaminase
MLNTKKISTTLAVNVENEIPFNKPYIIGKELEYIEDAVKSGKLSGNGKYSKLCHTYFKKNYGFKECLLTNSCTDALEMAALLLNIQAGDEVIMPSFTFVSTANAFELRGAKIKFADCQKNNPNVDVESIKKLISPKTKAIVVVHYAGVACQMDEIMSIAESNNLFVVEDAAQGIDSYYKGRPLGSIGHLGAFSFHETKNIISGEGGMLTVNDDRFLERAEIIWEKGTNRSSFFRGEVAKYHWVDLGSSYLPSEVTAAFLFAQLENLQIIQSKRKSIWDKYKSGFKDIEGKGLIKTPFVPDYATNNAHMFYLICKNMEERSKLITFLRSAKIRAVFHYQSLHKSPYFLTNNDEKDLLWSDFYEENLLRLPFYYELNSTNQDYVIQKINEFYLDA